MTEDEEVRFSFIIIYQLLTAKFFVVMLQNNFIEYMNNYDTSSTHLFPRIDMFLLY